MGALTYRKAVEMLTDGGVENARYEAALLFEKLLDVGKAEMPLLFDRDFKSEELEAALNRRVWGEPLQYILGEWDFYGLTFEVNESCLCPRPDTETAVELAIKLLPKEACFLELCTGSGCIPVSVCKNRGDVRGVATDLFSRTLETARRNARKNGVSDKICFLLSDVFDTDFWINGEGKELVPTDGFDAIISNPPYIPTKDIEDLSKEVKHEPREALDGGEDGLDFYREIIEKYRAVLKKNGMMIFEMGYDQAEKLLELASGAGCSCEIFKDLGGNDRVAVIRI